MAFDFPASPTDGTVFSPAGGPTYIFSGGVWKISGGGGAFVVVADAAPSSPYPGMLWFESDTGALFFWYVDADSSQWVQINFTPSGMRTAEARNRIVNGAMQISQENGSTAATVNGYYSADQFFTAFVGAVLATTQRKQLVTPKGSQNRYSLVISTADAALAAADLLAIQTAIEGVRLADFGWGTAAAKQAILRFGWKSPAGTYSIGFNNGPANRTYLANFTIATGQANTDTEQIFIIPGDVTGTWPVDNSRGAIIYFTIAAGTNFQGAANAWNAGNLLGTSANTNGMATVGNYFELFDVGLYLDPDNTGIPPKWQMPDEAQELIACQRYWQKTSNMCSMNAVSGTAAYGHGNFQVLMRATMALSGISYSASGYPNTTGPLTSTGYGFYESRVSTITGMAVYGSIVTANSRM